MAQRIKLTESYLVDLSYKDDGGNFITKNNELVVIYLDNEETPGTSHHLAKEKVEEQYPGCNVYSVRLM